VDAFVARPVVPYQDHFDENSSYDTFAGIYASCPKLVTWQETEFFIFSRNAGPQAISASAYDVPGTPSTARDIFTFGLSFQILPNQLAGWDYSLEAAAQLGTINSSTLNKRLDQQAYGVSPPAVTPGPTFGRCRGWVWVTMAAPATAASLTEKAAPSTICSLRATRSTASWTCSANATCTSRGLSASFQPVKHLTLSADYRAFWLWDTNDYLYPISGSGRNNAATGYGIHPNYDSFVGTELDLVATYDIQSWWNVQAGYGHFFVGTYIKQSVGAVPANGGAVDANFVYVQTTFKF